MYQTSGKFNQRYQAWVGTAFQVLVVTPFMRWAACIIKAAEKSAPEPARLFLAVAIVELSPDILVKPVWQRGGFRYEVFGVDRGGYYMDANSSFNPKIEIAPAQEVYLGPFTLTGKEKER